MEEGPAEAQARPGEAQGGGSRGDAEIGARFRVLGLDHVNITTPPELERDVLSWYRNCLGLREVEKPEGTRAGGGWFTTGSQQLHVSIDERNPPRTAHFAIVVDDFDGAVRRLRDFGCHVEQAVAISDRRRCYTRDPAGNRIEIAMFEVGDAVVRDEEHAGEGA